MSAATAAVSFAAFCSAILVTYDPSSNRQHFTLFSTPSSPLPAPSPSPTRFTPPRKGKDVEKASLVARSGGGSGGSSRGVNIQHSMAEDTAIGFGDDFATMGLLPSTISGTFLLTNYRIMFLAYDGFLHKASTSLRRAVGVVDLPHMAVGQLTVTTAEPTTISVKTKTFRTVAIKFGESRNGTWVSQVKALMDMQVFPRSLTPHNLDEIFAFNPEHRERVHAALLARPAADADSGSSGSPREGGGGASGARGTGGVLGSAAKGSETKGEESTEGKDGWLLYDAEQEFIRQVRSCDHKLEYHPCVHVCSSLFGGGAMDNV